MTRQIHIAYSDRDGGFLAELVKYLETFQDILGFGYWGRMRLVPGDVTRRQIEESVGRADAVIFLVSIDLLADKGETRLDYDCALARVEAGRALAVPILLRSMPAYERLPLSKYPHPAGIGPLDLAENAAQAWATVVDWIFKVCEAWEGREVYRSFGENDRALLIEIARQVNAQAETTGRLAGQIEGIGVKQDGLVSKIEEMDAKQDGLVSKVEGMDAKQDQLLSEEKRTQAMLAAQTDLLLHKLACIKAYQGTVYAYLRGMEDRLSQTNAQNHKELEILLACIEDGIGLALEELDGSKREELAAMSPKPGGAGLLDILKVKLPLIPLALGLLLGDEEKVAELLTEGLIVDSSVKSGRNLLVEAWQRARRVLG